MTLKEEKHIAKIIERVLDYTNGWKISDKAYTEKCQETASKIRKYLNRKK